MNTQKGEANDVVFHCLGILRSRERVKKWQCAAAAMATELEELVGFLSSPSPTVSNFHTQLLRNPSTVIKKKKKDTWAFFHISLIPSNLVDNNCLIFNCGLGTKKLKEWVWNFCSGLVSSCVHIWALSSSNSRICGHVLVPNLMFSFNLLLD